MHLTASSQPEREEQEYRGEGMPSPAAPKKYSKIQRFWRENREGWMFVFPLVVGLGLFTAYPMIQSLVWSFFNYTGATYYFPVGLNNFIFIFRATYISGACSAIPATTLSSACRSFW